MMLRKMTIPTLTTAIKGRSGTKTNRWDLEVCHNKKVATCAPTVRPRD